MTSQIDKFTMFQEHSESIVITYNNFTVFALWDEYKYTELHRWEYRPTEARSFDTELSKDTRFNVCKIIGVDDCDTI
jgi:hypothetical protein